MYNIFYSMTSQSFTIIKHLKTFCNVLGCDRNIAANGNLLKKKTSRETEQGT